MVFFAKMLANFVPTLCLGLSSSVRDLKFGTKLRDLRVVLLSRFEVFVFSKPFLLAKPCLRKPRARRERHTLN